MSTAMPQWKLSHISLILSSFCFMLVHTFNYSPIPNFVISAPKNLKIFQPQVRSSYFGYQIIMRQTSIIVGAPRAQSTLESQRKINETGAIYKCSLTSKPECAPFVFDQNGNINSENNEYTYDSEKKDNQWLGAAMDGGPADTDKLVVCAPRLIANAPNDYLLHGVCYWTPNTLGDKPMNVKRISPLKLKTNQIKEENEKRFYYYMLGEHGLSAHVTTNGEEILMGAPGIHTWKGSVIRYYEKSYTVDPSLSRRDTDGGRVWRQIESDEPKKEYVSEVPNPVNWGQLNDSYFGYAVGSGYFDSTQMSRLMYVATAPQANEQSGEAYLFDMNAKTINSHFVFRGTQFGEYFGYSILAEDINGDDLTDVIVSAPQHSISGSYDDGAIYIFINKGRFNFERKLLTSPVHGKARFGTTLTKLGDINHDGFYDIAVGAPFAEGNGSVYIYLGSDKGLRDQHSQLLHAPIDIVQSSYGAQMFGHGLSKGSDIDANGFNDFAIGAPNAESIYVYRAYPVVQIIATINSLSREIKPDQTKFQVRVCYMISTTSQKMQRHDVAMRIVVDPQVKRVKLTKTNSNEMSFNATASTLNQCTLMECNVRFSTADIFKPIELEMHYDIINGVPNSQEFCETCAAVDPAEPKIYSEKIIFSTGCASDICVADLQLKSALDHTYILGSGRTLSVSYVVTNNGETAYLPQLNITSSNRMPFARIPPTCKTSNDALLICDLNRGQSIARGGKDSLTVVFDVSAISGQAMVITAVVFSTGKELTPENNIANDVITLKEFTEIEAIGSPKTPHINLEKISGIAEIINNYEIRSNGPSTVEEIEIAFGIPVAYRVIGSKVLIPIIDMNNITVQATYDSQLIGVDFYQNNTQLIMNPAELSTKTSTKKTQIFFDSSNGMHYDASKMGHTHEVEHTVHHSVEHSLGDSVLSATMTRRRRRREALEQTASKDQYARIAQAKAHDLLSEELKGSLPINRTIVFNCNDPDMTICVRAIMKVYKFKPEKPITVTMKFNVDLKEVNQILIEPWEFFVILNSLDIIKAGDSDGKSLHVTKTIEYNVISKHQLYGTPIWVIILAVLGGLLALALITYGMYKAGFFKRAKKEEMEKLVHQNKAGGEEETETDNLNAENHE